MKLILFILQIRPDLLHVNIRQLVWKYRSLRSYYNRRSSTPKETKRKRSQWTWWLSDTFPSCYSGNIPNRGRVHARLVCRSFFSPIPFFFLFPAQVKRRRRGRRRWTVVGVEEVVVVVVVPAAAAETAWEVKEEEECSQARKKKKKWPTSTIHTQEKEEKRKKKKKTNLWWFGQRLLNSERGRKE